MSKREEIAREIEEITKYWQHEGDIDNWQIADLFISEQRKLLTELEKELDDKLFHCGVNGETRDAVSIRINNKLKELEKWKTTKDLR